MKDTRTVAGTGVLNVAGQPGFAARLKSGETVFQGVPAVVRQLLVLNGVFFNIIPTGLRTGQGRCKSSQ